MSEVSPCGEARANLTSLWARGEQLHCAQAQLHFCVSKNFTKQKKRVNDWKAVNSLSSFIASFMPIPLFHFSAKNITHYTREALFYLPEGKKKPSSGEDKGARVTLSVDIFHSIKNYMSLIQSVLVKKSRQTELCFCNSKNFTKTINKWVKKHLWQTIFSLSQVLFINTSLLGSYES